MKKNRKPVLTLRSGPSANGGWIKRSARSGLYSATGIRRPSVDYGFKGTPLPTAKVNVYIGPSVHGQPMKLVEVISGKVEDQKPSFMI